jgi:hypothetical protein
MTEREQLMADLLKHNDRLEALEAAGRHEDADNYLQKNRWILNYDDRGNWVGSVANENGWSA